MAALTEMSTGASVTRLRKILSTSMAISVEEEGEGGRKRKREGGKKGE